MKVEVGDKITMMSYADWSGLDSVIYTVVEIGDGWIKVKHPKIGGHFTFKKDRINNVVSEVICK